MSLPRVMSAGKQVQDGEHLARAEVVARRGGARFGRFRGLQLSSSFRSERGGLDSLGLHSVE